MLQEVTVPRLDSPSPHDLADWLGSRDGQPPSAADVLVIVAKITAALADLHAQGFAHGNLCPANIRLAGDAATIEYPPADDAGPDYAPPERKPGQSAVPWHDLYTLGVLWAKLLAGDLDYKLHPGWVRELEVGRGVPRSHLDLIGRCVGWVGDRPADAGDLARALRDIQPTAAATGWPVPATVPNAEWGSPPTARTITLTDRAEALAFLEVIGERLRQAENAQKSLFGSREKAQALAKKADNLTAHAIKRFPAILADLRIDGTPLKMATVESMHRRVKSLQVALPAGTVVQPHRGWAVFAVGLLGMPLPLLAPVAWSMGHSDLKAMEEGRMDRAGEANTWTGAAVGKCVTLIYGGLILLAVLSKL
jgi:hypothetical protein